MVVFVDVDETVGVSHPEVRRILGIGKHRDPDQVGRRMIKQGVPHLRIGRRIRFSIPALKQWAAERIAQSIEQKGETQESAISLQTVS